MEKSHIIENQFGFNEILKVGNSIYLINVKPVWFFSLTM